MQENALKALVLGGVQVVVQLERSERGRRVSAIAEVKGLDGGRFLLREIGGA